MASPFQNIDRLFGWLFKRQDQQAEPPSFSPREQDDGAANITATGAMGVYIDLDGSIRSEVELINRYKSMEQVSTVDCAVDEIVNEVIVGDDREGVKIVLDDLQQPESVKVAIENCFDDVLDLLDFKNNGYTIFKRWYVDGRIYFHVIVDEANKKDGIQELRYIDPRKIRKIRELLKKQVQTGGNVNNSGDAVVTQVKNEYYVFSDKGFNLGSTRPLTTAYPITGLKIAKDAIVHVTSGLTDAPGTMSLSFLHKAIKPLNMFSTLKDAAVVYRLVRSPTRRVWYIGTGNLVTIKAQQVVKTMMDKYRTRVNYDIGTGEIRDDRRFLTMLEDIWIPVKSNGDGTKVENLEGGANWNQIDDILFFQKELYISLHVPVNRIDTSDTMLAPAATTEISRDEIKFGKFITRLRRRFNKLFLSILEKQLVLKEVMTIEDFNKIKKQIDFQYSKDNPWEEIKDQQVQTMRWQLAALIAPFVGRWVDDEWVRKNILKQTDEDIEEIDQRVMENAMNPQFQGMPGQPPMDPGQAGDQSQGQDQGQDPAAGVMVDPTGTGMPQPPEAKSAGGDKSKGSKKSKKKGNGSFKSVASLLAKGT